MNLKKKCILILVLLSIFLIAVSAVSADGTFENVQNAVNNPIDGKYVYLNGTTYVSTGQQISINQSNLVIYGGSEREPYKTSTLDGNGTSRIMCFGEFGGPSVENITFIGINFINGYQYDFNHGNAILFYTSSSNNKWINCYFANNSDDTWGYGATINFVVNGHNNNNNSWFNCYFVNNHASPGSGGAIMISGSNNSWTYCSFINNTASYHGGAIYISGNNNSWKYCSFKNNKAIDTDYCGGAIYFSSGSNNNSWMNCSFVNNSAQADGGAIYFTQTSIGYDFSCNNNSWTNCFFINNTAKGDYNTPGGGAISFYTLTKLNDNSWTNCFFINNSHGYSGGAIYMFALSDSGGISNNNWKNCSFINNKARYGGALCIEFANQALFDNNCWMNCSFMNNSADNDGGAICIKDSSHSIISNSMISHCIFDNNNATQGKAILIDSDEFENMYNHNFWGTNNTITVDEFNNTGLITQFNDGYFNFVPDSFIVLNIDASETGYKLYFALNGTTEDISDKMPTYITNVKFNDTNEVNKTMGTYSYPSDLQGDVIIAAYSLFSSDLLAKAQANIPTPTPTPTPVPPVYELIGYDVIKFVNGTECYTVTLTADGNPLAGQEILITLNGEDYTCITDKKGTATLDLDLPVGTYTVTAKWYRFTTKNTITVKPNPVNYELTAEDVDKYFGGPECYTVTLTDNGKPLAGETITITLNGKEYTRVTDEKGTASMAINLNPGTYAVTASWNDLTVENTVTVKTTIHAEDFTKYYLNGTQYEAYVLDSQGNPLDNVDITFNIHGVFYHKEAHNGIVKLNINLLPGEYIITAYNDVTGEASSATVTVLPTLIGSDLTMSYKDGSKYECMFVDGQGNPVKGAEVTLNIHGVFYHKITDDEGIARLNINLLPGEYIITAIYDELTMTSNKITVRDL